MTHAALTGVRNELILENLKRVAERNAGRGRFPVVRAARTRPQHPTDDRSRRRLGPNVERIESRSYHNFGEPKYRRLGRRILRRQPPPGRRSAPRSPPHRRRLRRQGSGRSRDAARRKGRFPMAVLDEALRSPAGRWCRRPSRRNRRIVCGASGGVFTGQADSVQVSATRNR